jgi:hypothetical protein
MFGLRRAPVPPWLSKPAPPAPSPTVTPQPAPDSTALATASSAPVGPLVAAIQAAAETSAAAAETSAAAVETSAAAVETSAAPIESSSLAFASTELRAPSAADMLPANPFADLPPMALEHFIDCTMYEETGPLPIDMEPTTALADLGLVPPVIVTPREEPKPTVPVERPADPSFGVLKPVKPPPSHTWSIVVAVVLGLAGAVAGYLLRGLEAPTELVIVRPVEAGTPPKAVVTHFEAPAQSSPPATEKEPVAPAEPAPAPVAEPAPAAPKAEPVPVAPKTELPLPATTAAETASCVASITSRPKGAQVSWAGKSVGVTPLERVSVPCGTAVVVLRHPEFVRVEREVDAKPSALAIVAVHLVHPPGRLDLSSTPAGATFVVSGTTVGKAPTSADVTTFTQVEVSATLPGFKPWKQKVFVNERRMSVRAQLEPLKQP